MYQLKEHGIIRLSDNASIPEDTDNTDWVIYLGWLAAGNTPLPQFTEEELLAQALLTATTQLNSSTRLATAQVTALQARVDTINDAISGGYALPEEEAELPTLTVPLAAWKKYRVLLGRVSTQATWPTAPVWPVAPASFTNETSAKVASSV